MMTTTFTWTKNLAALLLSSCLALTLLAPSHALAFSRVATGSPDRTSSQVASTSATSGLSRVAAYSPDRTVSSGGSTSTTSGFTRSRSWSILAWWLMWRGGW